MVQNFKTSYALNDQRLSEEHFDDDAFTSALGKRLKFQPLYHTPPKVVEHSNNTQAL